MFPSSWPRRSHPSSSAGTAGTPLPVPAGPSLVYGSHGLPVIPSPFPQRFLRADQPLQQNSPFARQSLVSPAVNYRSTEITGIQWGAIVHPPLPLSKPISLVSLFGCTSFGIFCHRCNNPVGSSERRIKAHLKHHRMDSCYSRDELLAFMRVAESEVRRLSERSWTDAFLSKNADGTFKTVSAFVCRCGACFEFKHNLLRHCRSAACSFDPKLAREEIVHKTVCGRTVSMAAVSALSSPSVPAMEFSATEQALEKYIRADESVGAYTALFYPLVITAESDFDGILHQTVEWWSAAPTPDETDLQDVLDAAHDWVHDSARRHVEMVPGNLRAALQVFDGQLVGEVAQNHLYSFRHKECLLLPEVRALVSFLWRHPSSVLHSIKATMNASDPRLIPTVLWTVLVEEVKGLETHPLVVYYCLAR